MNANKKINKSRAIFTGALAWLFIFIAFGVLAYVPFSNNSLDHQALIVGFLIIPASAFCASVYYRNGSKANGAVIGLIMVTTALMLDALITVPFVEIPNGRTYQEFFSYPLLWLLVTINMATVYFYWKLRIEKN